jgi:hypothetical protein
MEPLIWTVIRDSFALGSRRGVSDTDPAIALIQNGKVAKVSDKGLIGLADLFSLTIEYARKQEPAAGPGSG